MLLAKGVILVQRSIDRYTASAPSGWLVWPEVWRRTHCNLKFLLLAGSVTCRLLTALKNQS
jgi:hypothetical protein